MSYSLTEIRKGLADTIKAAVGIRTYTYSEVSNSINFPAVIIEPEKAWYDKALNQGGEEWDFNLYVLVSSNNESAAQRTLDSFVTGKGPNSIREALRSESRHLGLGDNVDAHVYGMIGYGGEFQMAGTEHIGAILKARVHIS